MRRTVFIASIGAPQVTARDSRLASLEAHSGTMEFGERGAPPIVKENTLAHRPLQEARIASAERQLSRSGWGPAAKICQAGNGS